MTEVVPRLLGVVGLQRDSYNFAKFVKDTLSESASQREC
jgi:hypothetical protein